jgi:hypothetical protein
VNERCDQLATAAIGKIRSQNSSAELSRALENFKRIER